MKSSLINCKICGESFKIGTPFTCHIKNKHSLSLALYFETYEAKFDLHSGKVIPFKSVTQYADAQFISKKTEFEFLKKSADTAKCEAILAEQIAEIYSKERVGFNFPSYVEWRSSKNIRYNWLSDKLMDFLLNEWVRLGGEYIREECNIFELPQKNAKILIDTREQLPFFEGEKTSINVGDYTFEHSEYTHIHIDRKSHDDFIGTFTKGLDRFVKECEKAKMMDIYLVVLVESSFSEAFGARPKKYFGAQVGGQNAFHGVRKVLRAFPNNVQFLFCEDKDEARKFVPIILSLDKDRIKNIDLQTSYEKNRI